MKLKIYILFAIIFTAVLLSSPKSYALVDVPWTEVRPHPDYIVIGKLISVKRECFETLGFPSPHGEQFMVHDCGWIKVEELLLGDCDIERLPVSWISNIIGPGNPRGQQSDHELCREYSVGDHRIWILWNRHNYEDPKAAYYGVYEMPLDSLQNVENEISRIRGE